MCFLGLGMFWKMMKYPKVLERSWQNFIMIIILKSQGRTWGKQLRYFIILEIHYHIILGNQTVMVVLRC